MDEARTRRLVLAAAAATLSGVALAAYSIAKVAFAVISESTEEAGRLIFSLSARINSDLALGDGDVPEELAELESSPGVFVYGGLQELFLRRRVGAVGGASEWQWSLDMRAWHDTDQLAPDDVYMLDPPSLIILARLHLESVVRRKLAGRGRGTGRAPGGGSSSSKGAPRQPPPVALPAWAAAQLAAVQRGTDSGPARLLQAQQQAGSGSNGEQPQQRDVLDAPELLCCPITGQIMLQPVVLPSGKTLEFEAAERWIRQHGSDPTNRTPLSVHELYPNLVVRELVEAWLAGRNPLLHDNDAAAAAAAATAAGAAASANSSAAGRSGGGQRG